MRVRDIAMSLLMAVLAAACAETGGRWENPNVAEEQWSEDQSLCRRLASQQAEREYAIDRTAMPPSVRSGRSAAYTSSMARYDAERRRESLFDSCMAQRGYGRVAKTEQTKPGESR